MQALCRMVIETDYEDLPDNVLNSARQSILDTIGVIVGGSGMEGIQLLVDYVREKGGNPQAPILFYGGKVPASEAAIPIGTMARAMDLGQVHDEAGHCSEYIVPALIAAASLKGVVKGKDFITSFVVGQEVMIRIGMANRSVNGAIPHGRTSGHYIFGVVAAVGKLLGLSLSQLENAQGIARARTQPHDLAMSRFTTLMVRVHHGFICHDAIECCLLAKMGISGPRREVLTGFMGYLRMANWDTDDSIITEGLRQKWHMLNVTTKIYACCKGTHTAIAGILDQMREHKFAADDIAYISVDESTVNWDLTCNPKIVKWNPQTVPECQFSMPYVMATAAYDGKVFIDSFTSKAIKRAEVHDLMSRISARLDSDLPQWGARVTTTLKNGKIYTGDYTYVKGHPKNPLTWQDAIDKFKLCVLYSAYRLDGEVEDAIIKSLITLDQVEDIVNSLILPLTPKI